jgi:hypothetical protein
MLMGHLQNPAVFSITNRKDFMKIAYFLTHKLSHVIGKKLVPRTVL